MRVPWPHLSPSAAAAVLLGAAVLLMLLRAFLTANTVRAPSLQGVTLLAAPPPADAQPPAEEKPAPEEPRPLPSLDLRDWNSVPAPGAASSGEGTPASGPLGLAEAGGAEGDAFALAGRPGGRELLLTSEGGGNPGARFAQFAGLLQSHIQKQLNEHAELRRACYSVDVYVRVDATGMVEELRFGKATGQPAPEAELRAAFETLTPMESAPPADMPWPVGLRVLSRAAQCASESPGASEPEPTRR